MSSKLVFGSLTLKSIYNGGYAVNEKKLNKIVNVAIILFFIYPFALVWGLLFLLGSLRVRGRCKFLITGYEHLLAIREQTILVSNHPSVIDPFIVAALLIPKFLAHPIRFCPRIVADKKIFYDKWFMFWLRPIMIPVDRGDRRSEATSLITIIRAIKQGGVVIIFPEAGRTFKGEKFLFSKTGKMVRILSGGIGLIATRTNATILPIWLDGTDHVLPNSRKGLLHRFSWLRLFSKCATIRIGKSFSIPTTCTREEAIQQVANAILALADE